jgi:hypothetical protein
MSHNTYENSERHFWDELTRDAHLYREMLPVLRKLLHDAFSFDLDSYGMGHWIVRSTRYGNHESTSLTACLEWINRCIEHERRSAAQFIKSQSEASEE